MQLSFWRDFLFQSVDQHNSRVCNALDVPANDFIAIFTVWILLICTHTRS